jgi:hypothetical protein
MEVLSMKSSIQNGINQPGGNGNHFMDTKRCRSALGPFLTQTSNIAPRADGSANGHPEPSGDGGVDGQWLFHPPRRNHTPFLIVHPAGMKFARLVDRQILRGTHNIPCACSSAHGITRTSAAVRARQKWVPRADEGSDGASSNRQQK